MSQNKQILDKGQLVDEKYTVVFFIKKGSYAETYRVKDSLNTAKKLKLFVYLSMTLPILT